MKLSDIIEQIENVSKAEIKRVAPKNCSEIGEIIAESVPESLYEKMITGYLTSLCAEYTYPQTFHLLKKNLDYIGVELERGNIEVEIAGNMLGSCMKGGKIVAKRAGEETGGSMTGGEINADETRSIGNTIGGRIRAENVGKISKDQGAEIFIKGVRFKRGLLYRLFGKEYYENIFK